VLKVIQIVFMIAQTDPIAALCDTF